MKIKLGALIMAVVLVAMWFAVTPALADTFTISGILQGNISFSGTLKVNTSIGAITSYDVALHAVSGLPALTFTPADSILIPLLGPNTTTCPAGFFQLSDRSVPGWRELTLAVIIPQTTLVGFTGATILPSVPRKGTTQLFVLNAGYVGITPAGQQNLQKLTSGSITPVTPVPEPSSLFLLGTSLLGIVGAVRRKLRG